MDLFFYTNVCHFCKVVLTLRDLKRCSSCKLIFYCNVEHQRLHWPQHKQLCKATCKVYNNKLALPFIKGSHILSRKEWVTKQNNLMLLVSIELGRKLLPYEADMFRFPKVCMICFEENKELLEDCLNCLSVSYCKKHKNGSLNHTCNALRLNFYSSLALVACELNLPKFRKPNVHYQSLKHLPENMLDYINLYVEDDINKPMTKDIKYALLAEFFTRPLTFLYSIKKVGLPVHCESMNIHMIGANLIELYGLECWTLIFQWLPSLVSIRIFMIGPDLSSIPSSEMTYKSSSNEEKRISIFYHNVLYEKFLLNKSCESPDYIIGYNLGLHENVNVENDTWSLSLQRVASQDCPFIFTAYNIQEAEEEETRIKMILGNTIEPEYREYNPFSSLRPHRDSETGGVYYQNQYLLIYTRLRSKRKEK